MPILGDHPCQHPHRDAHLREQVTVLRFGHSYFQYTTVDPRLSYLSEVCAGEIFKCLLCLMLILSSYFLF